MSMNRRAFLSSSVTVAASLAFARAEEKAKKVRFVLYASKADKLDDIEALLNKVKERHSIQWEKKDIETFGEEKLKFDVLHAISVAGKIQISQSRKAKNLNSHLVVYFNDKPVTFYPQKRHLQGKGDEVIETTEFLKELLADRVTHLRDSELLMKLYPEGWTAFMASTSK